MDLNWEAIAAIGEAVGGLAVIVSLTYLAIQIRQSRELERATSIREMFQKGSDMLSYTATHPGTLDTLKKGVDDFSSLSAEEKEVFNNWGMHCLVTVEQAMYMHRDGLLPDASWTAFENLGLSIIQSPGGAQWWSQYSLVIGQEFVASIDRAAREAAADRPTFYDIYPHWRI
jgi:hypothetical protein